MRLSLIGGGGGGVIHIILISTNASLHIIFGIGQTIMKVSSDTRERVC